MFMFRVSKATCDIIEVFWFVPPPPPTPRLWLDLQWKSCSFTVGTQHKRQDLQTRATHCLSCAEAAVTLQINKVHERLQAVSGNCNILASVSAGLCALPTEGSGICQL